eukprot:scaffold48878_cov19-Prasinocladus_malaysianus.AAC.1
MFAPGGYGYRPSSSRLVWSASEAFQRAFVHPAEDARGHLWKLLLMMKQQSMITGTFIYSSSEYNNHQAICMQKSI